MSGKALRRRLFEREHLHEVVVHAEVSAMTFEVRCGDVVVEKGVVLEPRVFDLVREQNSGSA